MLGTVPVLDPAPRSRGDPISVPSIWVVGGGDPAPVPVPVQIPVRFNRSMTYIPLLALLSRPHVVFCFCPGGQLQIQRGTLCSKYMRWRHLEDSSTPNKGGCGTTSMLGASLPLKWALPAPPGVNQLGGL